MHSQQQATLPAMLPAMLPSHTAKPHSKQCSQPFSQQRSQPRREHCPEFRVQMLLLQTNMHLRCNLHSKYFGSKSKFDYQSLPTQLSITLDYLRHTLPATLPAALPTQPSITLYYLRNALPATNHAPSNAPSHARKPHSQTTLPAMLPDTQGALPRVSGTCASPANPHESAW